MKKKAVIAVSVILLAVVLVAGWAVWKMSKNPDKNPTENVTENQSDTPLTEYTTDGGITVTYSVETKTISFTDDSGKYITSLDSGDSRFEYWYENAETLVLNNGQLSVWSLKCFGKLKKIIVPENNPYYCAVDGVLFSKDMSEIIYYPPMRDGDYYKIPDGVIYVGWGCFNCQKLKKLVISDSVREIGSDAFKNALSLESVTLGKGVEKFKNSNVNNSFASEQFFNPFGECLNLWEILVDTENPWFCNNADMGLFTKDMKVLLSFPPASVTSPVNVPDSVETISASFRNCRNVKVINLGKNVTDIYFYEFGEYLNFHAFENCSSLEEINISPENTKYSSSNGIVYSKDGTVMWLYPQGKTNVNLVIPESVSVPYGSIYKNKSLKTIYILEKKPDHFVENGYFGEVPYPWIDDFDFPYEIYYLTPDGLSFEK